jgi:hypothetical protein
MTYRFNMNHAYRLIAATGLLISMTAGPASAEASGCSITGSYAVLATGTTTPPGTSSPAPFNAVAIQTFDGTGKWTAVESGNFGGLILRSVTISGTYTLNPDCTGTMKAVFLDGSTGTQDFVVTKGGKTIYAIGVDAVGVGNTLTTVFTRLK